jgi:hypothetical protein
MLPRNTAFCPSSHLSIPLLLFYSISPEILPALVASHFTKNVEVILLCDNETEGKKWQASIPQGSKHPITTR